MWWHVLDHILWREVRIGKEVHALKREEETWHASQPSNSKLTR